jgi:putative two-component system response regulator
MALCSGDAVGGVEFFGSGERLFMAASILVVDDLDANRDVLSRRLQQQGYHVECAVDGESALAMLRAAAFDLVMLDLMMPGMDGSEVLKAMKSDDALRHIPVIMVSANDEMENVVRCIELGAEDYLPKPFNPILLRARVSSSLQKKQLHDQEMLLRRQLQQNNAMLEVRVQAQVRQISSAQIAAIFAMSKLAESREPDSGGHLERLREYSRILARELAKLPRYGLTIDAAFVDAIYAAAPLIDIGKVGVPDAILRKASKLDPAEWEIMKSHTRIGGETLRVVDREHPGNMFIRMGIDIAESHHEQWDGSGYPRGLAGESIPLAARIATVGDVYDALTSQRYHKRALSHDESREIIVSGAGRHFDPEVVNAFLASEVEFVRVRRRFHDMGSPVKDDPHHEPRTIENA